MCAGKSLLAVVAMAASCLSAGELRVSPGGLSPHAAIDRIRFARAGGDVGPWTVEVAKGEYFLSEPLTLLPGDRDIVFRGADGAVFTGGGEVGPWEDDGNGVWSAPIPKGPDGAPVWFEMLYVNGRRAERARHPSKGFFHLATFTNFQNAAGKWVERVGFTNESAIAALKSVPAADLGLVSFCIDIKWCYAKRVVRAFDAETATLDTHFHEPVPKWAIWSTGRGSSVAFENIPAGFDDPGEWFYDLRGGRIRYRPLPGETLGGIRAAAPLSKRSRLLVVRGDVARGMPVENVKFENMTFEMSDAPEDCVAVPRGPTEFAQYQAAEVCDAAVMVKGARNVDFVGCTVRRTGNYAFRFEDGCRHCSVRRCTMTDLGAGGVWIGARKQHLAKGEPLFRRLIDKLAPGSTAFVSVEDCRIENAGNFNPEGTGVVIGHASDCRVEHNDIGDLYYSGVSVGWSWGYAGSVAQRNTVAFNRIHDLGKGRLSDMGGVYTLGTSYGTCVSNNVIWNVLSGGYGGWGLYNDEGSEGVVMENNLVYDVDDGGYHQHYGTDNIIRNNIIAFVQRLGCVRTRREYGEGYHYGKVLNSTFLYNNIVYSKGVPLAGPGVRNTWGVWANNLWFDCAEGARPVFDGLDWDGWKASGKEVGGVYADPLFVDAEARDFRIRPGSPALKLGFKPWDVSAAGVRQ